LTTTTQKFKITSIFGDIAISISDTTTMNRRNVPTSGEMNRVENGLSKGEMPNPPDDITVDQQLQFIALCEERIAAMETCRDAKRALKAAESKAFEVSLRACKYIVEVQRAKPNATATGSKKA
jgi:hypothetical protein